jgi:endo-1,4-beta-xylanase
MFAASFVLAAVLAAPALAATPPVSLLTDLALYPESGPILIRALLPLVSARKGTPFHFGSTYDVFSNQAAANFTNTVYDTVFNHMVAENGCKWYDTEPVRGEISLSDCKGVSQYAAAHYATFRGYGCSLLCLRLLLTIFL